MTGRPRRALRVLRVAGLVLGVLVLLLLAAFGFLFTDPGERLLKAQLISAAQQRTSQQVQIGRLEFHADRVVLHDVLATRATGEPTFAAGRAEVDLKLSTLLGRGVHFDRVALENYRVHLRRDGAPVQPTEDEEAEVEEEPAGAKPISIGQIALTGGVVEVLGEGGRLQLRLEQLSASGSLELRDELWSGGLEIRGEVTRPTRAPLTISAEARAERGLQIARIDAGSGENRLHADLQLPLADRDGQLRLEQLNGRFDLSIPRFSSSGFDYGPVRAAARFDSGQLRVQQLQLELPGLVASRDEGAGGAALNATVKLTDLATAGHAIEALVGGSLPPLAGQGELRLRLDNPITSAGLALEGRMSALRWGELKARGVKLEGHVTNLTRPTEGTLALDADELVQGETRLGGVMVKARNQDGVGSLDASVAEPMKTSLQLAIEQPGGGKPMRVQRLVLSYPEATWRAEGEPAKVRLLAQTILLEGLQLASGGQKIAVQGAWGSRRRNLDLVVTALRLEQLPRAVLPPTLEPAGRVDGKVKVAAPGGKPVGTANISISEAKLQGLTRLSGKLDARFAGERLSGTLTGSALEGKVSGRFDLPASAAAKNRTMSGQLTLEGGSVAAVWGWAQQRLSKEAAGKVKDPAGRLTATIDLAGTAADPRVKALLSVDDAAITYTGADRITGLSVRAEAEAIGSQLRLTHLLIRSGEGRLQVSGTARRAGAGRPLPYLLDVTAERFPLPLEEPMLATLKARISGAAGPERVTSKVSISNLRLEQVKKRPPPAASLSM